MAIENIEKEIMLNKLNALKKELKLKDKEIQMLSQGNLGNLENEMIDTDMELGVPHFEESFNLTNLSDNNNSLNDGNNNIADDQNLSNHDLDNKQVDMITKAKKPIFETSLKKIRKKQANKEFK